MTFALKIALNNLALFTFIYKQYPSMYTRTISHRVIIYVTITYVFLFNTIINNNRITSTYQSTHLRV